MDPSFCDLEFFDFENSTDEEIKEIQAILKGPKSEGCVKLPWETSMKTDGPENPPQNENAEAESAKEVCQATPPVLPTTTNAVLPPPPPIVPLPPPAVETFVTLPTTVGPYHNTPYFVSRTLPYLRTYPPMGMPIFACPLPANAGEASPYGFVPVESEAKRQSNRRGSSKKRLGSESPIESSSPLGCPTSVPLVPLSVPPSTFVGYPPGMHSSPAMYYVPVFNHPYGGYIQASAPHMMLPVNVATPDIKCPPLVSEDTTHTDSLNGAPPENLHGGVFEFESPKDNENVSELTRDCSADHLESTQTNLDRTSPQRLDIEAVQSEDGCLANVDAAASDSSQTVQSDCKSSSSDIGDNAAKMDVLELKEISNSNSKSPLSDPPNRNSFPLETDNSEEAVDASDAPASSTVQETASATTLPTKEASSKEETKIVSLSEATAAAKPIVPHPAAKCWADLFKKPSLVNGFESPPEPNGKMSCAPPEPSKKMNSAAPEPSGKINAPRPRKMPVGKGQSPRVKRDITNGKVPSCNSLH